MLYNEFVEGTGCKDNEHNYKVYKELELIYMNSDCSKAHIYEMGKKLVDNSKSEAELKVEAEVKAEIESIKDEIESAKHWVEYYGSIKKLYKEEGDKYWEKENRRMENVYKEEIKKLKNRINALKWVLA